MKFVTEVSVVVAAVVVGVVGGGIRIASVGDSDLFLWALLFCRPSSAVFWRKSSGLSLVRLSSLTNSCTITAPC